MKVDRVALHLLVSKVCCFFRSPARLTAYMCIDRAMVDNFMTQRPHTIDGRQTEPKRAMPRDEASRPEGQLTVKKLFIGGVKEEVIEDDLK